MRFHYLVAAHNEESQIQSAVERLITLTKRFPGSTIHLLDNGSQDQTYKICLQCQSQHPEAVFAYHSDEAGIGVAFRMGLDALASKRLDAGDWICLAAADLPFGFTDLDSVVQSIKLGRKDVDVFVGSKAHPKSLVARTRKRAIGTALFFLARKIILGLRTKDTQGSIFLRGDQLHRLGAFKAKDYFYAIEIIDQAERYGRVLEVPVRLEPESRPSRVRLVRDGWRLLKQLLSYRLRRMTAESSEHR